MMTNDDVRALKLGDLVRYHDRDHVVASVSADDPTPSVRLVGLEHLPVYPRDLEALPAPEPIAPPMPEPEQNRPAEERPVPNPIETPSA